MSIVLVHGGVSGLVKHQLPSLAEAARVGGRDRLDLVVAAVETLEDHPELNAGFGAILNRDGLIELDAGLADGATGRCSGVANVSVRHPIALARRVMESTPHVLLTGEGARVFGADMEELQDTTEQQRARWEKAKAEGRLGPDAYGAPEDVDTVGAVALDDAGCLAAASSTGGVFGKMPGRVGDAPIFGAGVYASPAAAVVGTGVGELFLRTLASARVGYLIERGADPQQACEEVIFFLGGIENVSAGLLAIDTKGRIGAAYRGGSMPAAGPDGDFAPARL